MSPKPLLCLLLLHFQGHLIDLEPSQVSALSPDLSLGARAAFEHLPYLTGSPMRHLTGGFLDALTSLRPLSLPTRGFGETRGKVRS